MGPRILFLLGAAAATVALFVGSQKILPAAFLLNLLTPLPAAYVHMRQGTNIGGGVVALSTTCLLFLLSPAAVVGYLLQFGLPSFLLPLFLRHGKPWDRAVLVTTFTVVLIAAPLLFGYAQMQNAGVGEIVRQEAQQSIDQVLALYEEGQLPEAQQENFKESLQGVADFLVRTYPAIATVLVAALLLMTVLLLGAFSKGHYVIPGSSFAQWKAPEPLIWVVIGAGFALVAPWRAVDTIGLNLLIVLLPVYFLQGLAVVSYYLGRRNVPPMVRSLFYFLILVLNPLPLVVTGVGIFDLWINFRKPKIKT